MTDWHPGKGDYIKRHAIEDSLKRKKNELKIKIMTYSLVFVMSALLLFTYVFIFD